jgi:cytochrome c oxidase subunit 1
MSSINFQIALGAGILILSLFLFLYVVARTWFGTSVENPVDDTLPSALSGPEHSPRVLDNMKLWTGIAILLVILAYAVPIGYIAADGIYSGSDVYPTVVEALETLDTLEVLT